MRPKCSGSPRSSTHVVCSPLNSGPCKVIDVGVKNDEQLIKIAAVVQRLVAKSENSAEGMQTLISDEERKQLMDEVIKISKTSE